MHDVDLEEEPDMEEEIDPSKNEYTLYTRLNPENVQTLVFNDYDSIINSNFNPLLPTVVTVHGWLSNQNSNFNPVIRNALLGGGEYNVIVLDWSHLARRNYVIAVRGVPDIGIALGTFLNFLSSVTGARLDSMHLVGFSLGAHVVGNAGRHLGGEVARITGLDPAGPLWNINSNSLSPRDGVYVEAIHTDGGYTNGGLGIGYNVADADFFVNGGISQPGCFTNICNHNRAWRLFASSVTNNHLIAKKCSNRLQIRLNNCRGASLHMGNTDLSKSGSGSFRVNTSRRYPF